MFQRPQSQQTEPIASDPSFSSDEIDLRELVLVLWRSKFTIVATTLVAVVLAAGYVYFSTPIYQTQAKALPPAAAGLEAYNKAYRMSGPAVADVVSNLSDMARERLMGEAIPILSPDNAYQYFARHVASTALRRNFFETHYLSSPYVADSLAGTSHEQLWVQFADQLAVTVPRRPADGQYITVTWTGSDPAAIAEWTNTYMQMAIEAAQNELAGNLSSSVRTMYSSLEDQIASLRAGAQKEREQQIIRLTEALHLAESIGLHKPSDAGNLITSYSGETAYMRGADALRNEIVLLKNRVSDDPFIPELTGVLMRQALLDTVAVEPQDIGVARIDEMATRPVSPIKPRKALILALSVVLGGMLGVFIVLIQSMFRRDGATA